MATLYPARQVNERRANPFGRRTFNERRARFYDRRQRTGVLRFLWIPVAKLLSLRFVFPLALFLMVGCGPEGQPQVASAAPTVQASPASQFGHLSPIQLAPGEFWNGWLVTPEVRGGSIGEICAPERYFFSTSTTPTEGVGRLRRTHTLRNAQGVPVLIVKD